VSVTWFTFVGTFFCCAILELRCAKRRFRLFERAAVFGFTCAGADQAWDTNFLLSVGGPAPRPAGQDRKPGATASTQQIFTFQKSVTYPTSNMRVPFAIAAEAGERVHTTAPRELHVGANAHRALHSLGNTATPLCRRPFLARGAPRARVVKGGRSSRPPAELGLRANRPSSDGRSPTPCRPASANWPASPSCSAAMENSIRASTARACPSSHH
jgi:hypothetical protein